MIDFRIMAENDGEKFTLVIVHTAAPDKDTPKGFEVSKAHHYPITREQAESLWRKLGSKLSPMNPDGTRTSSDHDEETPLP